MSENIDDYVPEMTITKYSNSCFWKHETEETHCAICRNGVNEPSVEYVTNPCKKNENGIKLCTNRACSHKFHLDCIERWTKTRSSCPLCNKEWEIEGISIISGYKVESEN